MLAYNARNPGFNPCRCVNLTGMMAHLCNPSRGEVELGRPEVQGYFHLRGKLKSSLRYRIPCLKTKQTGGWGGGGKQVRIVSLTKDWGRRQTLSSCILP